MAAYLRRRRSRSDAWAFSVKNPSTSRTECPTNSSKVSSISAGDQYRIRKGLSDPPGPLGLAREALNPCRLANWTRTVAEGVVVLAISVIARRASPLEKCCNTE